MCSYKYLARVAAMTAIAAAMLLTASCITNDIPYPRIAVNFSSIECEGALEPASIDSINRTVTFFLDEATDIQNVRISSYTLSPAEGTSWPEADRFAEGVDLSNSVETALHLYQDWYWSFSAVQEIERYFNVENQVGASTIDMPGRRIVAYVPKGTNIKAIRVTGLKLAGPDATYEPALQDQTVDFSEPIAVTVTDHGRNRQWLVYVVESETNVSINSVDAWTNVAWVYAEGLEGATNRMEYRPATDDAEWTPVPDEWITTSGGTFTARLIHLTKLTAYQVRAFSGDEQSAAVDFTTGDTYDLPDGSFDYWWLNGKVWNPWPEGGESYWDTGNKGATTLGTSNTFPTDDTATGSGQAACLETRFVGIGPIGKLAAGNIFAGSYVRTDGTNGILSFGRPFTLHPTKLKGWMKYKGTEISHASAEMADLKGQPDQCIIWIALIDTPEPFEIRTNPKNRQLFDPEGSYVVAYGKLQSQLSVDNWTPFEIELQYKSTSRTPRYMLITASASWLGDYFTGGNGSTLWIDNFELLWDY